MKLMVKDLELEVNEQNGGLTIRQGRTVWKFREEGRARLECREGTLLFEEACEVSREEIISGVGKGVRSRYEGFEVRGVRTPYAFETIVWIEYASRDVRFEWIPLCEEGLEVTRVYWPGEVEFDEKKRGWYTVINEQQGILIPNTWETELGNIGFDGFFGTAGGYMPWFGQVKERAGYLAVCQTPWNAGYWAEHPAGGPYTHIGAYFEPSLGKMDYRRMIRYTFLEDCDYNDLCKEYRAYVKEQGRLRTLAEKAVKNPSVDRLIGCAFVHTGIKTAVQENSDFFDPDAPDKNNHVTSFEEREKEMRRIHGLGVEKLYLHLDGWAEPGYDNRHPDYTPACEEAGGWEGMKSLSDAMKEMGYLFGIHDQYRDYYVSAPSFDEEYACQLADGTIPSHQRWAGGPQSYLCGTQAPYYVKRNFSSLQEHQIHLDGAYLDVFTCNEGDECRNPRHRMTRRECYEYRNQCFEYLLSQNILSSSEEVSDWSVPSLVFCHYAPYDFMLREPGKPKKGIPVPLYNLVYHDCVIEPWMMDHVDGAEDYMLYALLNAGAPYLIRDGAYPNFDGSFESDGKERKLEEDIQRCKIVSKLHEKTAKCEMLRHEILDEDGLVQRSSFADGTTVTVDFGNQSYVIDGPGIA